MDKPDIEWRERKVSGILGFSKAGFPQFGGETMFAHPYHAYADVEMMERFRPSKEAIRFLCPACHGDMHMRGEPPFKVKPHPIAVALKTARIEMGHGGGKDAKCGSCGAVKGSRWGPFYQVPAWLWWITPDTPEQDIEKALSGLEFDRMMKDATLRVKLYSCQNLRYGDRPDRYESSWYGSHGEYIRAEHDAPPPSGWWERWMDLDDLKPYVDHVTTHGHILYKRELPTP